MGTTANFSCKITVRFTRAEHDHIARLAKAIGKSKASYLRDLTADVLREDALAHGERVKFVAQERREPN
jgi:hypothetical protein